MSMTAKVKLAAYLLAMGLVGGLAITSAFAEGPRNQVPTTAGTRVSDATRQRIVSHLRQLQNVSAEMESTTTYTPINAPPEAIRGSISKKELFYFLDGRVLFDNSLTEDSLRQERKKDGLGELVRDVRAFSLDHVESLGLVTNRPRHHGSIANEGQVPLDAVVDVALGLRMLRSDAWMSPQDVSKMEMSQDDHGLITVRSPSPTGLMHTWTWEVTASGVMLKRCVLGREDGTAVEDVDASDFRETNGLLLPHKLVLRAYGTEDGKRRASRTTTCKVITYRVGDEANTPDRYQIAWPVKTVVVDRGSATYFIAEADGPRTIDKDEMLRLADETDGREP